MCVWKRAILAQSRRTNEAADPLWRNFVQYFLSKPLRLITPLRTSADGPADGCADHAELTVATDNIKELLRRRADVT